MTLAAVAALARGTTRITNIAVGVWSVVVARSSLSPPLFALSLVSLADLSLTSR